MKTQELHLSEPTTQCFPVCTLIYLRGPLGLYKVRRASQRRNAEPVAVTKD
jgi:hypothetical protein